MNTPSAPSPHWQPQTESHVINMREEEERQERTGRFWLWMALGMCGLALVAILGGYAFGNGILRGSHLREQFSMGLTEEAAEPGGSLGLRLGLDGHGLPPAPAKRLRASGCFLRSA